MIMGGDTRHSTIRRVVFVYVANRDITDYGHESLHDIAVVSPLEYVMYRHSVIYLPFCEL